MSEKNYKLLKRSKAAAFLSMSVSSFDTARKKNGFPKPVVMVNSPRWIQDDLERYIEQLKK